MKSINDTQGNTTPYPRSLMKKIARVLLYPLTLGLTLPAAVWAAPTPSELTHVPLFMESSVPSNVVFVMDDSQSMMSMLLPIPPGISPQIHYGYDYKLNRANPITGATTVPRGWDSWVAQSPTLNPNYYNPAVTYLPWKNDTVRMPNSDIGVVLAENGFRGGMTPRDPRYLGPNAAGFDEKTDVAPWTIDGNGMRHAQRGSDGLNEHSDGKNYSYFRGRYSWSDHPQGPYQDIFSRYMWWVTPACLAYDTGFVHLNSDPPPACLGPTSNTHQEYAAWDCATDDYSTIWTTTYPGVVSCPAATETGFIDHNPTQRPACPAGQTRFLDYSANAQWRCCANADYLDAGVGDHLCVGTSGPLACPCLVTGGSTNCPPGQTCPVGNRWVYDPRVPTLANYFRYDGPNTNAGKSDPANYTLVEIERYDNDDADPNVIPKCTNPEGPNKNLCPSTQLFPVRTPDGVEILATDASVRPECTTVVNGDKKACTWEQEAQNFANWYTYYRSRLFAAIGVTAEALSGLTATNMLDNLRLGYGSLNYFDKSRDPWSSADPWSFSAANAPTRTIVDVDPLGQHGYSARPEDTAGFVSNQGTLVRGVRAFKQGSQQRQEVFDWLFKMRTIGATPSREALDSIGRYFSRQDAWGPWSDYPGAEPTFDKRPVGQHAACRRSYAILVTDGEWTKTPSADATKPVQPLIEDGARQALLPGWVTGQSAATPTNASSVGGPTFNDGVGNAQGQVFPPPLGEPGYGQPQFFTVTGTPQGTLSDAAYYWWAHDLRPDLSNAVKPQLEPENPPERRNESFWQNVTPYLVGYGLRAGMDTTVTRQAMANRTAITWPSVSESGNVIEDSQCTTSDANGQPNGCGRMNDTLRAARMARGDFFAASDIASLARKVAEAFAVIGEVEGAATRIAAESTVLQAGNKLFLANFTTGRWTGSLAAYDAVQWADAVDQDKKVPAPLWSASMPSWNARNIFTAVGPYGTDGRALNSLSDLSASQAAALNNSASLLNYLLGDQSLEPPAASPLYRQRLSLLGDIINSSPLYSKAPNFHYDMGWGPEAAQPHSSTSTYRTFLSSNALSRKAALYVGANDGMMHAFDADNGKELFAYIPRAMYPYLAELASFNYVHRYFVDGPIVEGHVIFGANDWRSVLVGTGGAGPKSVYALDISTPGGFSSGDVLWDRTASDSVIGDHSSDAHPAQEHMGHIMAPGVIGSALDGHWYYFVGNGVESVHDKARLLMFDMQSGAMTALGTNDDEGGPNVTGPEATRLNGMGGVTPVYDNSRNIVAIYAGDRLGRVFKFDLAKKANGDPISTTSELKAVVGKKLFTAKDGLGNRQPISAAPRIADHPLGGRYIVFGTGKFYDSIDKTDEHIQSIYAVWERRPWEPVSDIGSRSALQKLTLNEVGPPPPKGDPKFRSISDVDLIDFRGATPDLGWYFDLMVNNNPTGERVVVSPVSDLGFMNIVSYEPLVNGDPCRGGGESYFYRLDVAQTFRRQAFDGQGNSVVGVSMLPSLSDPRMLGRPGATSAAQNQFMSTSDLEALVKQRDRYRNKVCPDGYNQGQENKPTRPPAMSCDIPTLRAWRELPRGTQ